MVFIFFYSNYLCIMLAEVHSWIEELHDPLYEMKGVRLAMLREDRLHPVISGNKWRKLKYNLKEAREKGYTKLLTFGGAFSNHIAAVAEAAHEFGFESVGVIRGESHPVLNPTLQAAKSKGMELHYINRNAYREKEDDTFVNELKNLFGEFYLIPEGGSNGLGVLGCEEILHDQTHHFDIVAVAAGTGATMAGLVKSLEPHQQVIGFPALKNAGFLNEEVLRFSEACNSEQWHLNLDYHFDGYAKINEALVQFMNTFHEKHGVPLDPVYTGKMMFGLNEMIQNDVFEPGKSILAIHTGGLQGIKGMNQRYRNKGIQITYDETA